MSWKYDLGDKSFHIFITKKINCKNSINNYRHPKRMFAVISVAQLLERLYSIRLRWQSYYHYRNLYRGLKLEKLKYKSFGKTWKRTFRAKEVPPNQVS